MILDNITSINDIKQLSIHDSYVLAQEIRKVIVNTVNENGGHLSSNLGAVELTIALHRSFSSPEDKIIFDVGHQTYAHKLLTGRYHQFSTLRKHGGIAGFPRYSESIHDAFEVGHASTSVSAALGISKAFNLSNNSHHVVAVIGDGALTGGMAYEALNDAGNSNSRLIVVLNDNEMSISKNVGAISKYLSHLRTNKEYVRARELIKRKTIAIPVLGKYIYSIIHHIKKLFKRVAIGENFFTSLGFHYLGPVDGHNISDIEEQLNIAKEYDGPVIVHCHTKKGYGLQSAEQKPDLTHGVSPKISNRSNDCNLSAGKIAANKLLELMANNDKIVVITAAMAFGTSTQIIKQTYPERFFDVGITEEHAVTFCAGLAKVGYKPYFFVYSTFIQRCFDQILHDVYLQELPVVFCIDRCNLSGADGITHHGIYDLGIFNTLVGFQTFTAYNKNDLESMLEYSIAYNSPLAIRYAKSISSSAFGKKVTHNNWYKIIDGNDFDIVAYGLIIDKVINVCKKLNKIGIYPSLYNARSSEPMDIHTLENISSQKHKLISIEEHIVFNGFGSKIATLKVLNDYKFNLKIIGITSKDIQHGSRDELLYDAKLDENTIFNSIMEFIG